MKEATLQYDLFGEIEAAEAAAALAADADSLAAAAFLASKSWGELLGWWLHPDAIEANIQHGEIKAGYSGADRGRWAYAIRPDGLRFEAGDTWQGFSHRPRLCIPWAELHALRASRPDLTQELTELAAGHGHPRTFGWRWWLVPYSMGTIWHPDYARAERQADYYDHDDRPAEAYADRMRAWELILAAVADAQLAVERKA